MLPGVEVTTPIEPVLPPRIQSWEHGGNVTFCLDVGPLRIGATEEKVPAATQYLSALPQCAVWLWTDSSLERDINNGDSGAVIIWPDGEEEEVLKTPAGRHRSSYRAVMLSLASGLVHLINSREWDDPIVICTVSSVRHGLG